MLTAKPKTAVNLIVTADELEDYLNTEKDTFFLPALRTAAEFFINKTGIELGIRESVIYGKREKEVYPGLSPIQKKQAVWVDIPIYPVTEVLSLKLDGEEKQAEVNFNTRPHKLYIGDAQEVEMTVKAGHAQSQFDEMARMAVLMLAGFIVEHRGACDLTDAAVKSGAQSYIDALTIFPFMI